MVRRIRGLVMVVAAMGGCSLLPTRIPAGRCESNSDCGGSLVCDLNRDLCVCPACIDSLRGDGGADAQGADAGAELADCACDDASADHRGDRPECGSITDCHDPTKPLCGDTGTCLGCGAAGAPSCASVDPTHPACGPLGACVECTTSSQCTKDPTRPLCDSTGTCVGCGAAGAPRCASVDPTHPACDPLGACVECASSSECTKDPTKPICAAGSCVSCRGVVAAACGAADPLHPVCGPAGACVECTTTSQCLATLKPYCSPSSNTCGPCSSDDQCTGRGPGVCIATDGHCAADTETIYVAAPGGTCDPAPAGSAAHPFCTLHDGVAAATGSRSLVVVRGSVNGLGATVTAPAPAITITGQQEAMIAPGPQPGLHVIGAAVSIRNITIKSGFDLGLVAELGATVRLDGVDLDSNAKGGLRVTASGFDVVNSLFVNNGGTRDTTVGFFGGAFLGAAPAGQTHRFDFNTVVQNKYPGVICEDPTQSLGADLFSANVAADVSNCIVVSSKTSADGDPMLTSSYRLTAPSACRNAVTQAPAGAPNHDIDGTARPQEAKYDCGASEFKP